MSRWSRMVATFVLLVLMCTQAQSARASERVEQAGNVPFYARFLGNEEWTAVIFYRPPSCVPTTFNLLDFFDGAAGACGPATTDGFGIFSNTPNPVGAPTQLKLQGLGAVPVWFVRTAEIDNAAADNVLTIQEIAALPSLTIGKATSYSEVLHPYEAVKVSKITVVASGTLSDGRSFQLQVTSVNRNTQIRIVF